MSNLGQSWTRGMYGAIQILRSVLTRQGLGTYGVDWGKAGRNGNITVDVCKERRCQRKKFSGQDPKDLKEKRKWSEAM